MKTREREGERGRERELAGTYMTSSKRWLRGVEAPSQTSGSTLFKMETKRVRKSLKKKTRGEEEEEEEEEWQQQHCLRPPSSPLLVL